MLLRAAQRAGLSEADAAAVLDSPSAELEEVKAQLGRAQVGGRRAQQPPTRHAWRARHERRETAETVRGWFVDAAVGRNCARAVLQGIGGVPFFSLSLPGRAGRWVQCGAGQTSTCVGRERPQSHPRSFDPCSSLQCPLVRGTGKPQHVWARARSRAGCLVWKQVRMYGSFPLDPHARSCDNTWMCIYGPPAAARGVSAGV